MAASEKTARNLPRFCGSVKALVQRTLSPLALAFLRKRKTAAFFFVLLVFSGFVFAEPSYQNMSDVYSNFSFIGNNLMFQVRTGNDPAFPGIPFVGPDNTSNTWFWENQTTNNLLGLLNTARYFQYNAFLYRNDSIGQTWSPNLYNVTVYFINSTETDVPSIASPVYAFTVLNCTTRGYSPSSSTVSITFSWYVNGVFNSSTTSVFNVATDASAALSPPPNGFTAGNVWNCTVNASDGSTSSDPLTTSITITAYAANTYALISQVYTDFSWYGGNTWVQVKSCWQPDCSDGVFFGPDNSSNTWFDSSPANLSLTNITQTRYFQFKEFLYCNSTLNQSWSPNLYNATLNAENASAVNVSLNAPANASWSTSRNVNFTFTPTDLVSFVNCSLSLYYGNGTSLATVLNTSNIANGSVNGINYTFASDATFLWNAACSDGTQTNSSASNRTVYVDATPPDTNVTVWNGFAWTKSFNPKFVCYIYQDAFLDWCQPATQNNDTSQSIYRVYNNGTTSANCLQAKVNETKTWAVFALGNATAPSAYNMTTGYTTIYGSSTAAGSYRDVYAWLHTTAFPSSDRNWKISFNYTNGC